MQVPEISRNTIGQKALHVIPYEFVRIEFGCIGRQKMDVESRVASQEMPDTACAVWETTVPKKHDVPSKMA
jgi:hypothetical protein